MIYVCQPYLDKTDLKFAIEAIKSSHISGSSGRFIQEFEDKFAAYCKVKYGIATTSGTTALHLALASLGIGEGDEVIVSNLTNIATVYSIVYCNAKPVVVDCDEKTWNIDVTKIEEKITKRTKAILVVHLYGHPVDMDEVLRLKRKYGLYLIEDAAEAHGAEYKGRRVGGFGDVACFSFYANKIITTGEGGMVVTSNKNIYERAQLLKNLAFSKRRRFMHYHLGFNYRMTNPQAAIGLSQLKKIDYFISKKIEHAHRYNQLLGAIEGVVIPPCESWAKNVYWMYGVLINKQFGISRDKLMLKLKKSGIETRTFFIPMHRQPIFKKCGLFKKEFCPISDELSKKGLYLPSGIGLTKPQMQYICGQIKKISNWR